MVAARVLEMPGVVASWSGVAARRRAVEPKVFKRAALRAWDTPGQSSRRLSSMRRLRRSWW